MTGRTLVLERTLSHPPEKVWRALTQTPLMDEWLPKSDFAPVVGHRFQFRSEPVGGWDGVIEAQVLEVEPPSRLAYTWRSMGLDSVVTWTLTPVGGGAHLRMEQSGFPEGDYEATPHLKYAYQGAQFGWTRMLDGMEMLLAGLDEA